MKEPLLIHAHMNVISYVSSGSGLLNVSLFIARQLHSFSKMLSVRKKTFNTIEKSSCRIIISYSSTLFLILHLVFTFLYFSYGTFIDFYFYSSKDFLFIIMVIPVG